MKVGPSCTAPAARVKRPGIWELPMGTPLREILEEHAGGMQDGVRFRGVLPGGASTDFLVDDHLDVPMDLRVGPEGGQPPRHRHHDRARRPDLPGRHGAEPRRILRAGIVRLVHAVLGGPPWVADMLRAMEEGPASPAIWTAGGSRAAAWAPGHTFCALAPGAAEPLQSALKYFRDDFERHIPNTAVRGD